MTPTPVCGAPDSAPDCLPVAGGQDLEQEPHVPTRGGTEGVGGKAAARSEVGSDRLQSSTHPAAAVLGTACQKILLPLLHHAILGG